MIVAKFVAVAVVGYLLGSIPFGIIIGRRMGKVDVRQYGSGKMGTTNVLRTAGSKAAVYVFVLDLLKGVGKIPVVMEKFIPGFAINRILRALGRETFFLLDNGYMTADQVDLAVKASIAPRMMFLGLVQRYDFTGLDLSARNLQSKAFIDPPIDNEPKSLFDLVARGDLGVKTGKGFFDYTDKPLEETLKERDDYLIRVLKGTDFCLKGHIGKKREEN